MAGLNTKNTLRLQVDSTEEDTWILEIKRQDKFEFFENTEKLVRSLMKRLLFETSVTKEERQYKKHEKMLHKAQSALHEGKKLKMGMTH